MRIRPGLEAEFEEMCENYSNANEQGKDLVVLIKMFGDQFDYMRGEVEPNFAEAWSMFLEEHKHQVNVQPMVGLMLYVLVSYWDMGPLLGSQLPTLERILLRDTVQDISDEIKRRSEEFGNAVVPAAE